MCNDEASKAYTKTASYCNGTQPDGSPNPCAALVYANGGGYVVGKVDVNVRNNPYDTNPACDNVSLSSSNNLAISEYGVFVVPAPCRYRLQIHISAGDKKGNHVYVTPGCEMVLESKGTTTNNNNPNLKSISWTDTAKKAYAAKGITVSNSDVSDVYWHKAQGQSQKHSCKIDN